MKKYAIIAVMIISICAAVSGFSQEDMRYLDDTAFAAKMRPPAYFPHDAHNEKAKIFDCDTCHHLYENGKKAAGSSEDRKCSECHYEKDNPMQLASAYHNRCKGCHIEKKAGPVLCGECHQK